MTGNREPGTVGKRELPRPDRFPVPGSLFPVFFLASTHYLRSPDSRFPLPGSLSLMADFMKMLQQAQEVQGAEGVAEQILPRLQALTFSRLPQKTLKVLRGQLEGSAVAGMSEQALRHLR